MKTKRNNTNRQLNLNIEVLIILNAMLEKKVFVYFSYLKKIHIKIKAAEKNASSSKG